MVDVTIVTNETLVQIAESMVNVDLIINETKVELNNSAVDVTIVTNEIPLTANQTVVNVDIVPTVLQIDLGAAGLPGAQGADGADGADGAAGVGVPTGGTAGQVLTKISGTDYDTQWSDLPSLDNFVPYSGGTADLDLTGHQVLADTMFLYSSFTGLDGDFSVSADNGILFTSALGGAFSVDNYANVNLNGQILKFTANSGYEFHWQVTGDGVEPSNDKLQLSRIRPGGDGLPDLYVDAANGVFWAQRGIQTTALNITNSLDVAGDINFYSPINFADGVGLSASYFAKNGPAGLTGMTPDNSDGAEKIDFHLGDTAIGLSVQWNVDNVAAGVVIGGGALLAGSTLDVTGGVRMASDTSFFATGGIAGGYALYLSSSDANKFAITDASDSTCFQILGNSSDYDMIMRIGNIEFDGDFYFEVDQANLRARVFGGGLLVDGEGIISDGLTVSAGLSVAGGVTLTSNNLTLQNNRNIVTGTGGGTTIATTTAQKVGFHAATPTIQRANAAQAAIATTAPTNVAPYGFTTSAQAAAIITLANELRAFAVEKGLIKGSA